jgi:hypothetical protein
MTNEIAALWSLVFGTREVLTSLRTDEAEAFGSSFDVTGLARAAVATATLAFAELLAARSGAPIADVLVSAHEAAAVFRSEALFEPVGWSLPPPWDPVAGDYRARDRWIRLHTNYAHHRRAALAVLGHVVAERAAVEAAVATWDAAALESAVVAEGGAAAAMYTQDEWHAHAHGGFASREAPVGISPSEPGAAPLPAWVPGATRALDGLRVLDLTRVIAGPVCTRALAAYGADVLRLDPPGFAEVPALVPDVTAGKRCAWLDLRSEDGASRFAELVRSADVLVHGFRPGTLARLGWDDARLRRDNPSLVVAMLDAYGWDGPWAERRGFDSLVQMSTGIAADAGGDRPRPLPAQALDHGAGWLLAAGVARALTERARTGRAAIVRSSLVGVANHLAQRPRPSPGAPTSFDPRAHLEVAETAWGAARRVACPGRIGGVRARWAEPVTALGAADPRFA